MQILLWAIPFFVVSGALMTAGDIANRLIDFAIFYHSGRD